MYKYLKKKGYPVETHWVQTEDGYMLQMQRLRHGRNSTVADKKATKPPVLLMHGLLCSAMDFVNTGPGKALGLILAEAGYDVWLGNNRGTTWSRNHVKLNPNVDSEFWDYSFETFGQYDLPAKIDYILEKTGHTKILYVGHSQGTAQFFAMAALRPEYNTKIALMSALAPVAYVTHTRSPILVPLEENIDKIEPILRKLGLNELFSHSKIISGLLSWLGSEGSPLQSFFIQVLFLLCGSDSDQLDTSFMPVLLSNTPAGISLKTFVHLSQERNSGYFRRYDYGEEKNKKLYGSSVPPKFDLNIVTAPVALYYAENDFLSTPEDVGKLKNELPNVVKYKLIDNKQFNHLDFLMAKDVNKLLYEELLTQMHQYVDYIDTPTSS